MTEQFQKGDWVVFDPSLCTGNLSHLKTPAWSTESTLPVFNVTSENLEFTQSDLNLFFNNDYNCTMAGSNSKRVFRLATEEEIKEALKQAADKLYPLGSTIISVFDDNKKRREVKPYHAYDTTIEWWVEYDTKYGYVVRPDNGFEARGGLCSNPAVYKKGTWVPVEGKEVPESVPVCKRRGSTKTSSKKPTEVDLLEEAKKRYPVGTEYVGVLCGQRLKVKGEQNFSIPRRGLVFGGDGVLYDNGRWAEIVEKVPIPTAVDDTVTVTRAHLASLRPHVCSRWQSIIDNAVKEADMYSDPIEVSREKVLEGYAVASPTQKKYIAEIFPFVKKLVVASDLKIGQAIKVVGSIYKGSILLRIFNGFVDLTNPSRTWTIDCTLEGELLPEGSSYSVVFK